MSEKVAAELVHEAFEALKRGENQGLETARLELFKLGFDLQMCKRPVSVTASKRDVLAELPMIDGILQSPEKCILPIDSNQDYAQQPVSAAAAVWLARVI